MGIKHILSYILRSTSTEILQKLLEMTTSNLKTERRTLQDILRYVIYGTYCRTETYSSSKSDYNSTRKLFLRLKYWLVPQFDKIIVTVAVCVVKSARILACHIL